MTLAPQRLRQLDRMVSTGNAPDLQPEPYGAVAYVKRNRNSFTAAEHVHGFPDDIPHDDSAPTALGGVMSSPSPAGMRSRGL
jgi:hypothetical protein